ncbi:hypothetical protein F9B85_13815 [Heliorestis acidaminivorans]|uniref:DUF262 domain-containing protein n=1 Tax=Heliorestis acidaminivorans TaxID=553427 RepID=A0A6I0EX79_9FIRM|nr:hypothetical protein [Heliorestis acidaminivorans]KAB2950837.1 hypothetical protein F9B85_13815 [Heliorestis acidaminivorans]
MKQITPSTHQANDTEIFILVIGHFKLKDGTSSFGKRILIDGQQRITALIATLFGLEVVKEEKIHSVQ